MHPRLASWRLDGKPLGREERVLWLPWPGRHVLELVNADGSSADSVRFEVRGATAHQAAPPRAGKPGTAARGRAAPQPSPTPLTSTLQDSTTNGQKL